MSATLTSWGIFAVFVIGAGYYYTTSGGQKKRGTGWKPFTPSQARRRDSSRQRRGSREKRRKELGGNGSDRALEDTPATPEVSAQGRGGESMKKRKEKKPQPSKLAQSSSVDKPGRQNNGNEAHEADLDVARQHKDKMTGTSSKKQDGAQNKKARKQAQHDEATVAAHNTRPSSVGTAQQQNSTASSTTDAEADDDLSSSTSLDLGPTPSGGDVSDMLEPPKKGPSILQVTEPSKPHGHKNKKPQEAPQEQETKKQRQNRKKREVEKAQRELDEQERRKALETQRRTAREARGEPAKNGLVTSQPPVKNAWTGMSKAGGNADTVGKVPPSDGQLLDTFEEPSQSEPASQASPDMNGRGGYGGLPSEEDQMKLLSEMDSDANGWNTVSKGGKKMKQKPSNARLNESAPANSEGRAPSTGSESVFQKGALGAAVNAQANGVDAGASQQSGRKKATKETIDHSVWNRSNIHEHPDYDPKYPYALTGHPDDSDWAVV